MTFHWFRIVDYLMFWCLFYSNLTSSVNCRFVLKGRNIEKFVSRSPGNVWSIKLRGFVVIVKLISIQPMELSIYCSKCWWLTGPLHTWSIQPGRMDLSRADTYNFFPVDWRLSFRSNICAWACKKTRGPMGHILDTGSKCLGQQEWEEVQLTNKGKGPVKLIKRVKIAHSFLQPVSNQFHVIILSLPM